MEFKQRITNGFPELFAEGTGEQDYSAESQFATKYGWFASIFTLAQGDITRFNQVTEQPLTTALMFLEFEKEKTELEIKRNK